MIKCQGGNSGRNEVKLWEEDDSLVCELPDQSPFHLGRLRQHHDGDGQVEEAILERLKLIGPNHLD